MKIAFTFLFVLSQSDNVKIHQRLIPEEKKATKEKKKQEEEESNARGRRGISFLPTISLNTQT